MKFLDNLIARFRKKVDAKNDEVKANTERVVANAGILATLFAPTVEETVDRNRQVRKVRISDRLPRSTQMYRCGMGYYLKRLGHAPFSGPAPTINAAEKAALRNIAR